MTKTANNGCTCDCHKLEERGALIRICGGCSCRGTLIELKELKEITTGNHNSMNSNWDSEKWPLIPADRRKKDAEIVALRNEIDRLRAENAAFKDRLKNIQQTEGD